MERRLRHTKIAEGDKWEDNWKSMGGGVLIPCMAVVGGVLMVGESRKEPAGRVPSFLLIAVYHIVVHKFCIVCVSWSSSS